MPFDLLLQMPAIKFFMMVPGLMLAIAFLQSGWDKIVQRQGNLDWFKGHFAKTMLGRWPSGALTYLTLLELGAGVSYVVFWISAFWFSPALHIALSLWLGFNGVTLVSLFLGQRLAGDYAGAANINGYTLIYLAGAVLKMAFISLSV
jgi:hypothetical protein